MKITMEQLTSLIAEVLNVAKEQLSEDSGVDQTEGWDSFSHLQIFMLLEEQYRFTTNMERISQLTTLKAIHDFINDQ